MAPPADRSPAGLAPPLAVAFARPKPHLDVEGVEVDGVGPPPRPRPPVPVGAGTPGRARRRRGRSRLGLVNGTPRYRTLLLWTAGAAGRPPVRRRPVVPSPVRNHRGKGATLHEDTHHGRRSGHLARSGCGSRNGGRAEQGRQGRRHHDRCCCVPASDAVHGTGRDSLGDLRSHGTESRARTAVDGDPDPAG